MNQHSIQLNGAVGEMARRALDRIRDDRFSLSYLAADLDFNMEREFTNYSGDVSGRFIELMALVSAGDRDCHPALRAMLENIPPLQTKAGHFGVEADWTQPIDEGPPGGTVMMPILWGSSRMLPGLVEAYVAFGDETLLETARKLGDFYIRTADALCNPNRVKEYREKGSYAEKYVTCYFPGMEGLAHLYEVTGEQKYLQQAERMAAFRQEYDFDKPPIHHIHGYLCCEYALLQLYELTGKTEYLTHVEHVWTSLLEGGHVGPAGGLLEKGEIGYFQDEGCALADWLRVNLKLWDMTGAGRYLDMAARTLFNHFPANQCKTGGFGCRYVQNDNNGQIGFGKHNVEAPWCCDFHCAMAMKWIERYAARSRKETLHIGLPVEFDGSFEIDGVLWQVSQVNVPAGKPEVLLRQKVKFSPPAKGGNGVRIAVHIPDWADDVILEDSEEQPIPAETVGTSKQTTGIVYGSQLIYIHYIGGLSLEDRHCRRMDWNSVGERVDDAVLRYGPELLTLKGWKEKPLLMLRGEKTSGRVRLEEDFRVPVWHPASRRAQEHALEPAGLQRFVRPMSLDDEDEAVYVFDLLLKQGDSESDKGGVVPWPHQ